MKRREFLKAFTGLGMSPYLPMGLTLGSFANQARALTLTDYQNVGYTAPSVMPQVINIFLYGGPSELAGNLSNIRDIEANSQNSYRTGFTRDFLQLVANNGSQNSNNQTINNAQVTANRFWENAGGLEMEAMLAAGDMSVYRTMLKRKSPTRSHRESLFLSHKGTLDIEGTPGIGTRLAAFLKANQAAVEAVPLADGTLLSSLGDPLASDDQRGLSLSVLPFVSFEGETNSYAPDIDLDPALPLNLRGITLNESFDNPYNRNPTICCGDDPGDDGTLRAGAANNVFNNFLDNLTSVVRTDAYKQRFSAANESFVIREQMDGIVANLSNAADETLNPLPAGADYTGSRFSDRVKAAVTLALHNPSSFYITVGGGLGGWDDHNNGVDRYPNRMQDVMRTLQAAMAHINGFNLNTVNGQPRNTNGNIVINMFGDFGRLVNLNDSNGWDHANTQNLYTFGGQDIRTGGAAALGKVVGQTHRVGTSGTNNQYTLPVGLARGDESDLATSASTYTFEPMAVAASVYRYFGAQDTALLTNSIPLSTKDPDRYSGPTDPRLQGEDPIDETQAAVQPANYVETGIA